MECDMRELGRTQQRNNQTMSTPETDSVPPLPSHALLSLGKATIVEVGTIVNDQPRGFCFDCATVIDGMHVGDEPRWAGWTLDELREVIARPSEFCDNNETTKP